jgi:outer membrane autotransporter protein
MDSHAGHMPCWVDSVCTRSNRQSGNLSPGEATGNCTFVNKLEKAKTTDTIRNFLNRRIDLLASNEPDRARLQRRFDRMQQPTGSLKDEPPMKLGSADGGGLSFSTSLSQVAQANGQMKLGARDGVILAPPYPQVPGVDVWAEGHFQRWKDDLGGGDRSGNFDILYVGADYLVNPWILIGALVQFDWMDDGSQKLNTDVSGNGWMAGPYISFKLADNILFDARGAWGQSSNEISPVGTYKDSFDTDRWLAKANVTGNWFVKGLRISPSAGVIYVEETQHSYVDTLGSTIDSQSVHIGRLTFGPEFGYAIQRPDGMVLEPHVSFTGMWDFDKDSTATVDGLTTSTDNFRVKVEGGLIVCAINGVSARATLS